MSTRTYTFLGVIFLLISFSCGTVENQYQGQKAHAPPPETDENVILPPAWAFGVLYGAYTNQEQSIQLIQDIVAHEYPIDAFWIDSWIWDWENEGKGPAKYMDFVADTVSYPDMEAMWTFMEEKNIKAGMWMWDAIQLTGNEQAYADFKDRGYFKEEIIHTSSWHNGSRTTIMDDQSQSVQGTWMGNIDFENPEAVAYFKQRVQHFFDKGVDFVKLDKTDDLHVVKAMFELSQELGKESAGRGFVLSHSGGVEDERYKRYPAKWTDDTRSDWTVADPQRSFSPWLPPVAFRENLEMYTDTAQHFHKIPFLANDMGGFAVSEDRFLDEELYIRWVQMAHWLPLTTPFAQPENETGNIAFKVSPKADSVFRKYAQQKMRLFPYIYSYAHRTRWEGKNAVRTVPGQLHTYQLGEEFLISPVLAPDLTSQEVFLPIGNWVEYHTGKRYAGGRVVEVPVSLEDMPVFVKEGAIIPLRNYARAVELGSNDTLALQVYVGSSGRFTLYEDDGKSNDYLQGIYLKIDMDYQEEADQKTLTLHPAEGFYTGLEETRHYALTFISDEPLRRIRLADRVVDLERGPGNTYTAPMFSNSIYTGFQAIIE